MRIAVSVGHGGDIISSNPTQRVNAVPGLTTHNVKGARQAMATPIISIEESRTGRRAFRSTPETFWKQVEKTEGCWLWRGSRQKRGYGTFMFHCKMWLAHRFAWELTNGPIPEGLNVCHHCDNVQCVRPDHLFLGTQLDNMRDCASKGRMGIRRGRPRLTADQVQEIRDRYFPAGRIRQADLAKEYGVDQTQISRIIRGDSWKRVES